MIASSFRRRSGRRRPVTALTATCCLVAALAAIPASAQAATAHDFVGKLHHAGHARNARLSIFFYPSHRIVMSELDWSCTSRGHRHKLSAGSTYAFFMHVHVKRNGTFRYALVEHRNSFNPTYEKVTVRGRLRARHRATATVHVHAGLPGGGIDHARWRARGRPAGVQG